MSSLALPSRFPFDDPTVPYRVAHMQVSDLPQVMGIEREAFPSPWPLSAYRYELTENDLSTYLVLKLRQPVRSRRWGGMALPLRRRMVEPLLGYGGFWMMAGEAHISTLAVHPKWRGRGLGEMVLVGLIDAAILREAMEVTLEVRASNVVAQNLYRKYGFEQVGRRKGYYHDNHEDALIMTTPRVGEAGFIQRYRQLKVSLRRGMARHLEPHIVD